MHKPWFHQDTGDLLIDNYVTETPSYRHIIEDDLITEGELFDQAQKVVALLRQLEANLPVEIKPLATEALTELAVLHALQQQRIQQTIS